MFKSSSSTETATRSYGKMAAACLCAAALALSSIMVMPAFASDTPWNNSVTVSAHANNPGYTEDGQNIDVTMTFSSSSISRVGADDIRDYIENNTTIADRSISDDGEGDAYIRVVSNVAVNGDTVTFTIGPNTAVGQNTANYSGELKIAANAVGNQQIAAAMGYEPVETLIANGIAIEKLSGEADKATFEVTARAQHRGMNHILITNVVNDVETPIYEGTGTFENGGTTIHSHSFTTQTEADYAQALVEAVEDYDSDYKIKSSGAQFTICNCAGVDCTNLQVYVYDCDYLNAHDLSVGEIYEPEWNYD